jgi:lysophospholipase L1-like esterase
MKTILCFGDSNTWGYDPATGERYPAATRWPGVLATALAVYKPGAYEVIAEGQNGRTTVWDDPFGQKNGSVYLLPCLESHKPVDLVIIMLGTNDLKHRFSVSSYDVAKGLVHLAGMVKASEFGPGNRAPAVLIVAPPPFARLSGFAQDFLGGAEKSLTLGREITEFATLKGFSCFDAGTIIHSSDLDGIHLDSPEHEKLGRVLAKRACEMIG